MKTNPTTLIERGELNLRQGIKSSLSNLRSVVAMLYGIYLASDKKTIVEYSKEYTQAGTTKIKLNDELRHKLKTLIPAISNESIDIVPIFTSQMEALQVGIELFFKLGKISFVEGHPDSSERAGGNRFNKVIKFGTNIKLIDLYLSTYTTSQRDDLLNHWINNNDPSDGIVSDGLKQILTIFSEETQFKIRTRTGEISFQQEGIYKELLRNNTVESSDIHELVGPFRIFKSFVREGLHPYIKDDRTNGFELKETISAEFDNYQLLVTNGLDIIPKRTTLTQVEISTNNEEDIFINNINVRSYSMQELGQILKNMYSLAEDKKKILSIHMFGIKYGKEIRKNEYSALSIIKASGLNASYVTELSKALNIYDSISTNLFGVRFDSTRRSSRLIGKNPCLQQIFYGAPGTGKSHKVKEITEGKSKTVVTFHPDTDYSSFVGAYKPTLHEDGKTITYGFVPQAFAKAYVNAWKDTNKDYYLVIEEINRGNCAQIFGDIFQLLDRNPEGYSDYVIDVDKDFEDYLKKELSDVADYPEKIMELAKEAELEGEFSFTKIALPANLRIIATMNTSDQSLFPMDSAFKRRWDWVYRPIDYNKAKEVKIDIDGEQYNWGEFIETVNGRIKEISNSEDKQLGTFFVKVKDGVIPFEQFRSKVMFYLWFEVYKDEAGTRDCIFKQTEDDSKGFSFGDLFEPNATEIIKNFLKLLKINPISSTRTASADTSADTKETE